MMKLILLTVFSLSSVLSYGMEIKRETTYYLDCVNAQVDDPGDSDCEDGNKKSVREHIPYGLTAKLELTIPTSGNATYYLYNPNNTSENEEGHMIPVTAGDYTEMTIKPKTGICEGVEIGTFELNSGSLWDWELTDGTGDYGTCVVTDTVSHSKK